LCLPAPHGLFKHNPLLAPGLHGPRLVPPRPGLHRLHQPRLVALCILVAFRKMIAANLAILPAGAQAARCILPVAGQIVQVAAVAHEHDLGILDATRSQLVNLAPEKPPGVRPARRNVLRPRRVAARLDVPALVDQAQIDRPAILGAGGAQGGWVAASVAGVVTGFLGVGDGEDFGAALGGGVGVEGGAEGEVGGVQGAAERGGGDEGDAGEELRAQGSAEGVTLGFAERSEAGVLERVEFET